jgi:hypothetical protein
LLPVRTLGLLSASGKLSPPRLASVPATLSVPSHLTPPLAPCAGPRASPKPGVAPQPEGLAPSPPLSFGAVDRTGELCLSIVHPPRFDPAPGTVSGRCVDVHGCFPWTSSHRSSSHRPSLAAPCRALCGPRRGLSTVSASRHTVPGHASSLGSTSMHSLAIG